MPSPPKKQTRPEDRRIAGGVRARDLPRLWRRDWQRAYSILSPEPPEEEPGRGPGRALRRSKAFLLELVFKLSPSRRLLLILCLVLALFGLETRQVGPIEDQIEVYEQPLLLFVSVLGLVFLLILELADRVVVRDELEVARQIQRDLLPSAAPELPGYEFAFSYRSANTVGGDYYDFLTLGDGRVALATGDASGHGMAAAMLMAISRTTFRVAVETDPAPGAVARTMNRALIDTGGSRAFLTLFYALLEPDSGRFDYVCAGHPFPMLRQAGGTIAKLGEGSFPLGIRPGLAPSTESRVLHRGELLLLYSDGFPEAVGPSGEAFGFERLESALAAGGGPAEVHDRIMAELEAFVGAEPIRDDLSLVVIARQATPGDPA